MININENVRVRIPRRASSGAPGAFDASTVYNAELAFNEADDTLYYGKGISTGINSQNVIAIGGPGTFLNKKVDQTISGKYTYLQPLKVPNPAALTDAANRQWTENLVSNSLNSILTSGTLPFILTFRQENLTVGNKLIVNHGRGNIYPDVKVWNDLGELIVPDEIKIINADTLVLDMENYLPFMGEFTLKI